MTLKSVKTLLTKIIITAAFGLFVFFIAASSIPYIRKRRVREELEEGMYGKRLHIGSGTAGPDRACVIETPQDALNVRIALARSATATLDITYHTFKESVCADAFLGEVLQAADRGVRVRILLDGKLGALRRKTMRALQQHPQISFRLYNPLRLFQPWKWHAVLHDKYIIADEQWLLLGGRNFDPRQFGLADHKHLLKHDRDVLVWKAQAGTTGRQSVLEQIRQYNDLLWNSEDAVPIRGGSKRRYDYRKFYDAATRFEKSHTQFYALDIEAYKRRTVETFQINLLHNPIHTSRKKPWVAWQLKKLLSHAKEQVIVQTPFATASEDLLTGMVAAARQVRLTVLTNSLASSPNTPDFRITIFKERSF